MCKCKKIADGVSAMNRAKANVTVEVNVTKIVKYACIAGVAIVGCIFGSRACIEYTKMKNEEED